jgi:hypothetical protein
VDVVGGGGEQALSRESGRGVRLRDGGVVGAGDVAGLLGIADFEEPETGQILVSLRNIS